ASYLWISTKYPSDLVARFEASKQKLLDDKMNVCEFEGEWILGLGGRKAGAGAGPYYAYKLLREGMEVFFAANGDGSDGFYNIIVRFGALPLTMHGHDWCFSQLLDLFKALHVEILSERLSQVDMAVDLVDYSVEHWQGLVECGAMVTRGRSALRRNRYEPPVGAPESVETFRTVKGVGTGFRLGRGTMIRVYDKLREVCYESPGKRLLMIEYRWGGRLPEAATRVEVQIRRDWLKENRFQTFDTFADFVARQVEIFRYFFTDWFRLLESAPDRNNKHQSRIKRDRDWAKMVDGACAFYAEIQVIQRVPCQISMVPDRLLSQLIGVAQAVVARAPERYEGTHDDQLLAVMLQALFSVSLDEHEIRKEKLAQKILLRRAVYPIPEESEVVYGFAPVGSYENK
ncbi:TPA: hypothetical protein DDW35_07665, partial [Candidatus Sumerlaeota bacterium]|nr:hypothetical protein [Candidatus Sumerlaeota bacterium]